MQKQFCFIISSLLIHFLVSCNTTSKQGATETSPQDTLSSMETSKQETIANNFGADLEFLKKYDSTTLLLANGDAKIIVSPLYQGRIMTATTQGEQGLSMGWLNYKLIESGQLVPHINAFGGADRFWLGPEGGQYAIFFKKGDTFDTDHWQTPAPIDSEPFELVSKDEKSVKMQKKAQIANFSGTTFDLKIDRTITLLDKTEIEKLAGAENLNGVQAVGYQSENQITNTGKNAWTKEGGLLSIWILGMFNASPNNTVAVPIVAGEDSKLGIKVNDDYFGKIAADRLSTKENLVLFKADGKLRSKIGISPQRSKDIMGSYDTDKQLLTITKFTFDGKSKDYVNSQWKIQENPYGGDVSNSYNDGGGLGNFYELETSSPAKPLKPNESMKHLHATFHFTGDKNALDAIAKKLLGIGIEEIK